MVDALPGLPSPEEAGKSSFNLAAALAKAGLVARLYY
jgi:hypothetical protein